MPPDKIYDGQVECRDIMIRNQESAISSKGRIL